MEIDYEYKPASWELEAMLVINQKDLELLQKAIIPVANKLKAKVQKYRDIHESGEATSKQEDILIDLEMEYETYAQFLHLKV